MKTAAGDVLCVTKAPPLPKPVELPPLVLVGAVVGEGDAIAILVDETDQKVIRMGQGETRAGWSLTSVQTREFSSSRESAARCSCCSGRKGRAGRRQRPPPLRRRRRTASPTGSETPL